MTSLFYKLTYGGMYFALIKSSILLALANNFFSFTIQSFYNNEDFSFHKTIFVELAKILLEFATLRFGILLIQFRSIRWFIPKLLNAPFNYWMHLPQLMQCNEVSRCCFFAQHRVVDNELLGNGNMNECNTIQDFYIAASFIENL